MSIETTRRECIESQVKAIRLIRSVNQNKKGSGVASEIKIPSSVLKITEDQNK